MGRIIELNRSVIISCDVENTEKLVRLIKETRDIDGIGGYKIGSILAIQFGLPETVSLIRELTDLPIIYDHQKAMTDIPELGERIVRTIKEAGVNALIGFPLSGPRTEESWIKACKKIGLEVIIGGEMTNPAYKRSEGGYISDEALDEIYLLAAKLNVNNFVVPANKVERAKHYHSILKELVKEDLTFFATGFIVQGGRVREFGEALGKEWHAIVGRAIYEAKNIKEAAEKIVRTILNRF